MKRLLMLLTLTAVLLGSQLPTAASATSFPPASVQATTNDCDGNAVLGRFRAVESGASFSYNGRRVELQNESGLDTYSRAEIKSGRRSGDLVWVDRSYRRFSITTRGIISNATAESEGWKQCGPFSGSRTQSVINSVFAARACARIDGVSVCGKWYKDCGLPVKKLCGKYEH